MKGFIVYPTYENIDSKTQIHLFGKLENGESFVSIHDFSPYFYIETSKISKISKLLKKFKTEDTTLTNFQENKVTKISSDNQTDLNKLYKAIHKVVETYEADIKPHYRFMIDNNLLGTLEISEKEHYESSEKINRIYQNPKISPVKDKDFHPKLSIASIDTEWDDKGNLICIGIHSEKFSKVFMVTKHEIKNTVSCSSESDCLEKFRSELFRLDPDIITGWNFIDFDLPNLKVIFEKNKVPFDLGRTNSPARLRLESNFFRSSSANIPGRQVIDALNLIRDPFIKEAPSIKNADFDSYTLEDVSQEILHDGKLLKGKARHEQIISLYNSKKKQDHQTLSEYNLQDCILVYKILEKTKLIDLSIERSQLTGMPLDRQTASIAAFDSLYIREANSRGLVSPTLSYTDKPERITGGYVKSVIPGIYHNVLVLDFKSLYPSILKTFNIDPSSLLDKKPNKKIKYIETPNKTYFKNVDGILPDIISKLHEAREIAKKEHRELSSYAIKIIMNSFWGVLASPNCRYFNFNMANSITGFAREIIQSTAKEIEKLGYKTIYSDSIGGKTKIIIKKNEKISEELIENLFTKINKKSLGKEYNFKEKIEVLTLDEKGNSVFKPIKYVMRHKADKKMYRVNFTNNWYIDVTEDHSLIGYQSLAFNNKKQNISNPLKRLIEIKPSEIGEKANTIVSLKKIPIENPSTRELSKEVYEFMGYFIGDGSFQRNNLYKKYKKDYYLRLSLGFDQEEVIKKLIIPLKKQGYIKNYWISKTRKGDVTINGLKIVRLIAKNFSGDIGKKIIPLWLFEEKDENISSFLRGLFSADGCVMIRDKAPIIKYTSIHNSYMEEIRRLLYRVGISHSIFKENSVNKYKAKNKTYTKGSYSKNIIIQNKDIFADKIGFILDRKNKRAIIKTDGKQKRHIKDYEFDIQAVKSIEEIRTPDYVYDIEVDDLHRFFANYALVHNTDSVFILSDMEKEKANALGPKIADYINDFYKTYTKKNYNRESFLELEFEKQYLSLMLPKLRGKSEAGAKKRYAGLKLDPKTNKEEVEIVGLEAIRGDWTDAAQEFQVELLDKVFHKQEVSTFIRSYIKKLLSGALDKKLIYRKSIRKNLDEYTKTTPPHVKAARKLLPSEMQGNIIQYYITLDGPEPIQALKHKLDYNHYIEKQIKPIAQQILTLFNKDFDDLLSSSKQTKLF